MVEINLHACYNSRTRKFVKKRVMEKTPSQKEKVFQLANGPIRIYSRVSLSLLALNNEVNIYKLIFFSAARR